MAPGAYILGCAGPVLRCDEAAFFRESDPWGFILFARNVRAPQQLRRLTASLREAVGRDAPILVDQEGGRVARLQPPIWRDHPPPLEQAAIVGGDAIDRSFFLRGLVIGTELRQAGIDVNCAPIADIAGPATHAFLRNRCYGTAPDAVARRARALYWGQRAAGVAGVLKHIPGHGRGATDSHLELPVVDVSLAELEAHDFAPFRALADLEMGMTAHVLIPALDAERPVTLSPAAIRTIRQGIGFAGLLMSDDISMGALSGSVGTRTRQALAAGCDLVTHCNGAMLEMAEVAASAGRMGPAAMARGGAAEAARGAGGRIDMAAAAAEFDAMLGRAA